MKGIQIHLIGKLKVHLVCTWNFLSLNFEKINGYYFILLCQGITRIPP